jgi:cysteine-rich repeat protein
LIAGCPSDATSVTGTEDGSTSGDDTTAGPSTSMTTPSTTATVGTSPSSSGMESSDTGTPVGCGDGEVADDELCDDGNDIDDDECSNDCIPSCGLLWEYLLEEGPELDFVTVEDGEIRVGGTFDPGNGVVLYQEVLDGDGNSLEQDEFDVGFDNLPLTYYLSAVPGGGSALFSDHDLGSGTDTPRIAKFDGDGGIVFDVDADPLLIDEPEDRSIVVADDGDVVIGAAINVDDGDDDIYVARLGGGNGNVRWSGTHGGPLVGGFSTDDGGPVAVAGDGSVYILGRVRQDLGLTDLHVVKFDDGGGAPAWVNEIRVDTGAEDLVPASIEADEAGNVLVALVGSAGATTVFEISLLDPAGEEQWKFTFDDLDIELKDDDDDLIAPRVRFAPDGTVTVAARIERGVAGDDLAVFRLDGDGQQTCIGIRQVPEIEGDRRPVDMAVMPDGGAVVIGAGAGANHAIHWIARFRP